MRRASTHRISLIGWLFLAPVLFALTPLLLVLYVQAVTFMRSFDDAATLPVEPMAIVFGAAIGGRGSLSPMLADRVLAATNLYRAGKVRKLLMSGDNSSPDYDEVTPMRRFAMARGVPAGDILLDHEGLSTYESCYRARTVFGIKRAVLVTQRFHLPRALYTCSQLGVDAVGLGTPDWGIYSDGLMLSYSVRESLASLKALWELHVSYPAPFIPALQDIK